MKQTTSVILLSLTVFSLSACAKKTPLTTDQTLQLKDIASSTAALAQASSSSYRQVQSSSSRYASRISSDFDSRTTLAQALANALSSGQCGSLPSNTDTRNLDVTFAGASCPFNLTAKTKVVDGNSEISLEVSITDPYLKTLTDIDQVKVTASLQKTSSTRSANFSATMHSQKYGNVTLSVQGEGNQGGGQLTFKFTFSDFESELKMKSDANGMTYELNDKVISEQEGREYLSNLKEQIENIIR